MWIRLIILQIKNCDFSRDHYGSFGYDGLMPVAAKTDWLDLHYDCYCQLINNLSQSAVVWSRPKLLSFMLNELVYKWMQYKSSGIERIYF